MSNLEKILTDDFDFNQDDLDQLFLHISELTLQKGEYFLKAGNRPNNFGFIESGAVVYFQLIDGIENVIDFEFENGWNLSQR